ncbi:MAG: type II toxin-antitoxin system HicA family toxin [bacterium]|nr:type II toxin-antitoxin system HicA family toxin [bacterium]
MSPGRMPMLTARDVVRLLIKLGFSKTRQVGSHAFFEHFDGRVTTVSIHSGEDIGRGLLRKILRDIKLTPDELSELL